MIRDTLRDFINLIYPLTDFVEGKNGRYISSETFSKYLPKNFIQRCHVCGGKCLHGLAHTDCLEQTNLDGLIHVTYYNNLAKDLIKFGKYEFYFEIFYEIGEIMSEFLVKFFKFKQPLLVPIPLYKRKLRQRGFNQAEIIAQRISEKTKIESINLLQRIKSTKTQVGMHYLERKSNLINSFKVSAKVGSFLDREIILVDDVFTSGATLEECAKILKENGISKVYGYTFAKARSL
ncbi:MAG: hypothetical protein Kow0081_0780 [Candidatus Dojkabacteria bacterium]